MKEINKLHYFAMAVLLGACLVIGFTMKYADRIDSFDPRMNDFPKNWEQIEKGHPIEIYTPKGIPQYSSIWRGADPTRTLVSNHYEFWVNGERVVYLVLDDPNQLYLHLSLFDSTTLKR